MPLGQLAADEETEPGAGLGPNCRIVNPEEALEDLFVLVSRDADAMVLEDERRAFVEADGQVDPWLPGGIGQGVVEQVVDDARQLFTVGVDPDRLSGSSELSIDFREVFTQYYHRSLRDT